jgi:hypothetical protein
MHFFEIRFQFYCTYNFKLVKQKKHVMRALIIQIAIILLFGLRAEANVKLGTIVDKNGYIVLRGTPDQNSVIIDTIKQGDLVNCDSVIGNWIKVIEFKWFTSGKNYGRQIIGYVQKSGVKIIETLTIPEQKTLIINTLNNYAGTIKERKTFLNSHFNFVRKKWHDKADSIKMNGYNTLIYTLADTRFNPMLVYIEPYYCRTKDTEVLNKLFAFLFENKGAAKEQPALCLAGCFICTPERIQNLLNSLNNAELVDYIKELIALGLAGHYNVDPDAKKQTNKEYIRFRDLLKYNKK